MCYSVYIGTQKKLKLGQFKPEKTDIYFEIPTTDEVVVLRKKFTKPNIYYVGSDTNCSCGLSLEFLNPNEKINNQSPAKFLEFLNEMTLSEDIEFYCCLEGEYNQPTVNFREIDLNEVSLDQNYFGLNENEFILFEKQM